MFLRLRRRWIASPQELQGYAELQARQAELEENREAWWLKVRERLNIPNDVTIRLDPGTGYITRVNDVNG